jgi:hypothetical protein
MSNKRVKLLISVEAGDGILHARREYELPADQADEYVKKRWAVYVNPKGADAESATKDRGAKNDPSQAKWAAAATRGDHFSWQVRIKLPLLAQPFINPDFADPDLAEPGPRKKRQYLQEIGGDGDDINSQQAKALDFLVENEQRIHDLMLQSLARYSSEFRADWEENADAQLADAIVPRNMSSAQAAERIEVQQIEIAPRFRDGFAYIEIQGNCTWDPEHGFTVVLHRDRLVDVCQQGTGWTDPLP